MGPLPGGLVQYFHESVASLHERGELPAQPPPPGTGHDNIRVRNDVCGEVMLCRATGLVTLLD
eukprot:7052229-Alexandrium_andersonii.AAC.1